MSQSPPLNKDKKQINITYPEIVQNRKEDILHHHSTQSHKSHLTNQTKPIVELEENQTEKKQMPHLEFQQKQGVNITMGSTGVRSDKNYIHEEQKLNKENELVEEKDEEEGQTNNGKKLPHIDFEVQDLNSADIAFVGKKADQHHHSHGTRSKNSSVSALKEIQEDNQKEETPTEIKKSPQEMQLHNSLNKIEEEIKVLERDSPHKFKKTKSYDSDMVQDIIQETQDEMIDEKKQKGQGVCDLKKNLAQLEQDIDKNQDKQEDILDHSSVKKRKMSEVLQFPVNQIIDEKEELEKQGSL